MLSSHKYIKVYPCHASLQPLMRRFQAALKDYLTKQIEKVKLDLQELVYNILCLFTAAHHCPGWSEVADFLLFLQRTATKEVKVQQEELRVIIYRAQQQLAQQQVELEKSHERCSRAAAARQQLEEELEGLRLTYKKMCQNTADERKRGDWGGPCNIS